MADIQGLRPEVRSAWAQAEAALNTAGISPRVASGYRPAYPGGASPWNPGEASPATPQSVLYDAYVARGRTGTPAAPPGKSNHQQGAAMDISISPGQRAAALPILQQYGFVGGTPGDPNHFDWRGSSDGTPGGGAAPRVSGLTPVQQTVVDAANQYGVPPHVLLATIQRESSFQPGVTSTTKTGRVDVGLGQLSPGVAQQYGVKDRTDPGQNAAGTAQYLLSLKNKYGDWDTAVAHYIGYHNADAYRSSADYQRQSSYEQQWQSKLGSQAGTTAAQSPSETLRQRLLGDGPVVDPTKVASMLQPISSSAPSNTTVAAPSADLRQRLLGDGPVVDPGKLADMLQPISTGAPVTASPP